MKGYEFIKDQKPLKEENALLHKKVNEYKETLEVMSDKNATAAIIKELRKKLKHLEDENKTCKNCSMMKGYEEYEKENTELRKEITELHKKEFVVDIQGDCKRVFIPRGYCTIFLENQAKDHIEVTRLGDSVCIENLSPDFKCQKVVYARKTKKVNDK